MTLTIEEAIARVPQWANTTDLKSSPLTGGITNENFRIEVNGDVRGELASMALGCNA